jgi:hypothetical protein
MGCQSGYVRSAAGDDGNTSGQMKEAKFTMTMAKVIWRMKMSKMIIATKIMSKVITVVNFIPFFSFLMSMVTITKLQMSC